MHHEWTHNNGMHYPLPENCSAPASEVASAAEWCLRATAIHNSMQVVVGHFRLERQWERYATTRTLVREIWRELTDARYLLFCAIRLVVENDLVKGGSPFSITWEWNPNRIQPVRLPEATESNTWALHGMHMLGFIANTYSNLLFAGWIAQNPKWIEHRHWAFMSMMNGSFQKVMLAGSKMADVVEQLRAMRHEAEVDPEWVTAG
jgi:hypothetical protein